MNIQIFGKKKCFATKKAQRFFKERRIKFQMIDVVDKGFSAGELKSIIQRVGKLTIVDTSHELYDESNYANCDNPAELSDILYDYYEIVCTPIVRSGRNISVGHQPDQWTTWLT